jgi:hypothetical protein
MSIRRFLSFSQSSDSSQSLSSSQSDATPPTYASSVTSAPSYASHNPGDRIRAWSANVPSSPDSETRVDGLEAESDWVEASGEGTSPTGPGYRKRHLTFIIRHWVTEMLQVYYRVYTEDGAIPCTQSATPDDPYLGRVKVTSIAPPQTYESVCRCIAKAENISTLSSSNLFLNPSSLNGNGPGSPLALVVKLPDSELKSRGSDDVADTLNDGEGVRYRTSILPFLRVVALVVNYHLKCITSCTPRMAKCPRRWLLRQRNHHLGVSVLILLPRLILPRLSDGAFQK